MFKKTLALLLLLGLSHSSNSNDHANPTQDLDGLRKKVVSAIRTKLNKEENLKLEQQLAAFKLFFGAKTDEELGPVHDRTVLFERIVMLAQSGSAFMARADLHNYPKDKDMGSFVKWTRDLQRKILNRYVDQYHSRHSEYPQKVALLEDLTERFFSNFYPTSGENIVARVEAMEKFVVHPAAATQRKLASEE